MFCVVLRFRVEVCRGFMVASREVAPTHLAIKLIFIILPVCYRVLRFPWHAFSSLSIGRVPGIATLPFFLGFPSIRCLACTWLFIRWWVRTNSIPCGKIILGSSPCVGPVLGGVRWASSWLSGSWITFCTIPWNKLRTIPAGLPSCDSVSSSVTVPVGVLSFTA